MIKNIILFILILSVNVSAKDFKAEKFIISYSKDVKHANRINSWGEEIIYHLGRTLQVPELKKALKIKYNATRKRFPTSIVIYDQMFYTFKGGWYDNATRKVYLSNHRNPYGVDMQKWTCSSAISKALFHELLKLKPSASYNGVMWFEEGFSLYLSGLNDLSYDANRSVFLATVLTLENKKLSTVDDLLKVKRNEFFKMDSTQKFIYQSQVWCLLSFLVHKHKRLIQDSIKKEQVAFDLKGLEEKVLSIKEIDQQWQLFINKRIGINLKISGKSNDKKVALLSSEEAPDIYSFVYELKVMGKSYQETWLRKIIDPSRKELLQHFVKLIKDKDPIVRRLAARAMALYQDRKALEELIKVSIYDPELDVRKEASKAIRILNFEVLPSVYYFLMKKNTVGATSLRNMSQAITEIGDPDGVNQLISILKLKQSKLISKSEFTTSRAYIVDYDVDDGVLHPVIKRYKTGRISETRTIGLSKSSQNSILHAIQSLSYESEAKSYKDLMKWYKSRKH